MAYATEAAIASEALHLLGARPITDLDSITDQNAIMMNTVFDSVRDEMLGAHNWQFARQTVELTEDTTSDNHTSFDYAYVLPADLIRIIGLVGESGTTNPEYALLPYQPYEVRENLLFSDEDECWVQYVKKVTDVTEFPHWFGRALAAGLATECAIRITEDKQKYGMIQQIYGGRLTEAMRIDGYSSKETDVPGQFIEDVG